MESKYITLSIFIIFVTLSNSKSIVKRLPGFRGDLPFTFETGYVGIGAKNEIQFFYYFVESQRDPAHDPLLLYLTGGPGTSGLFPFLNQIEGEIPPESSNRTSAQPTTFFVSNLPDGITSDDLREEYRRCGRLVDVYMARKKDKFGKYFAFVRYENVINPEKVIKALNNMMIWGRRVYARVARFSKEDSISRKGSMNKDSRNAGKSTVNQEVNPIDLGPLGPGRLCSFREKLTGMKDVGNQGEVVLMNLEETGCGRAKEWVGKSVVGKAKNYFRLCKITEGLKEFVGIKMEVRYLGGMCILITFSSPEKMDEFIVKKELWMPWFVEISEWKGQVLDYERLTWIKISGLPVMLNDEETVEKIGAHFGEIVREVENGVADSDLSAAYVGVMVKQGKRIEEEIKILWRGQLLSCWVSEGAGRWLPDYIGEKVTIIGEDGVTTDPVMDQEVMVDSGIGAEPVAGDQPEGVNGDTVKLVGVEEQAVSEETKEGERSCMHGKDTRHLLRGVENSFGNTQDNNTFVGPKVTVTCDNNNNINNDNNYFNDNNNFTTKEIEEESNEVGPKKFFYFNAQTSRKGGSVLLKETCKRKKPIVSGVKDIGDGKPKARDNTSDMADPFNLDKIIVSASKKTLKRRRKDCQGFDLFGNYAKTPGKRARCNMSPLDLQLMSGGYDLSVG